MIKELKNVWAIINGEGWVILETVSFRKSIAQCKMSGISGKTWHQCIKLHGYRCIKVNIQFTEVK